MSYLIISTLPDYWLCSDIRVAGESNIDSNVEQDLTSITASSKN